MTPRFSGLFDQYCSQVQPSWKCQIGSLFNNFFWKFYFQLKIGFEIGIRDLSDCDPQTIFHTFAVSTSHALYIQLYALFDIIPNNFVCPFIYLTLHIQQHVDFHYVACIVLGQWFRTKAMQNYLVIFCWKVIVFNSINFIEVFPGSWHNINKSSALLLIPNAPKQFSFDYTQQNGST